MTAGEIATLGVVASALINTIPPLMKWRLGFRLSDKKVSLDEIRQRSHALDSSYDRLDKDNTRLREDNARLKGRVDQLEEQLRGLGQRIRNLPPNGV